MRTKDVKNMLDILATEVKIHEIDKAFLDKIPKKTPNKNKLRVGRILLPIILCICFSTAFITLLVISINKPLFGEQTLDNLSDTKREITYQLIETLSLINDDNNLQLMSDSISDDVLREVEKYYKLACYGFDKNEIVIDSLVSDDANYQNKYRIKLKQDVYFYFNETSTDETNNIDSVSSSINGYVLFGTNKFTVEISKEVNGNIKTITLKVYYNEDKYLESYHQIGVDLNKYDFLYFVNGAKEKELILVLEEHISYNQANIVIDDKEFKYILQADKTIVDVKIPKVYSGKIIFTFKNNEFIYQTIE